MGRDSSTGHSSFCQENHASSDSGGSWTHWYCDCQKPLVRGKFGLVGDCYGDAYRRGFRHYFDQNLATAGRPTRVLLHQPGQREEKGETTETRKRQEEVCQEQASSQTRRSHRVERRSIRQSTTPVADFLLDEPDHHTRRTVP